MHIVEPGSGNRVNEPTSSFTCDESSDGDEHERVVGHTELRPRGVSDSIRSFDSERNQTDVAVHVVQLAYVSRRIVGLTDDGIGSTEQPANCRAQRRVQVRRAAFARIEQVPAVHGQNVGNAVPACERMSERSSRHDEMRVDDVESVLPSELQAARKSGRQIREHRRKICDSQIAAKEHGHAYDSCTCIDAFRRQFSGAGSQHGHFVTTCKLPCERRHYDTAASAKRRVFVITKQDSHAG